MSLTVSIAFILLFLLYMSFLMISLKKEGLTFKLGICFGVLYFIFIPVFMMVTTGVLLLPVVDFGITTLSDVVLQENIRSSWILILFLSVILGYLFFPSISGKGLKSTENSRSDYFVKWQIPLAIYAFLTLFIFIRSGMLEGGNWYNNRHDFMNEGGALAVLMVFTLNASKVLFIAVLFNSWRKDNHKLTLAALLVFLLLDMLVSGNRIYAFITGSMILLTYFNKYPVTVLKYSAITAPLLFIAAYFGTIFRHMRGPLFEEGVPGFKRFKEVLIYAVNHEPPDIYDFLSGISESVNVNVIYDLFNRYTDFLYGSTYLKTILFPIPRSIWQSKPISITSITGEYFGSVSLVTTFIGEMFMNFSYFGIALLPLFLILTEYFLKVLFKNFHPYTRILLFIIGLMIFRMPYSDTILVALLIFMILRISAIKWKFTLSSRSLSKSSAKPIEQ